MDQAKRLKELGVKQESLFYYAKMTFPKKESITHIVFCTELNTEHYSYEKEYAAFAVAELGVMLPEDKCISAISEDSGATIIYWREQKYSQDSKVISDDDIQMYAATEASARAAMLIYLLEQNFILVNDVNSRL